MVNARLFGVGKDLATAFVNALLSHDFFLECNRKKRRIGQGS